MIPDVTAARLCRTLKTAGVEVVSVYLDQPDDQSTWRIQYADTATEAQRTTGEAILATFNPNDPAHVQADLDEQVKRTLDTERLISAVVWTVIDTYSAPATVTKYQAARTKIIAAYKAQPWKG